ncbi:P-loop containing nucleoside triphosphate hydrolase protein [Phlebopus sp. FC_14]|nr:P-loop containing nucleoside triphosphate hydrolase protein [Phlebopus sp. FC_14]
MQKTYNVVVFGETGVGKSSIVNLITGHDVAQVSSDAVGCTKDVADYAVELDSALFHIWDTPGLESAQTTTSEEHQTTTLAKTYSRIWKLQSENGGIDLLVYCITGRRDISVNLPSTIQSHYRLFYELLGGTKVPVVLVVTEVERGVQEWWKENRKRLERLDVKVSGHVCVRDADSKAVMSAMAEALRDLIKANCTPPPARQQYGFVRDNLWWRKEMVKSWLDPKMLPEWRKRGIQERTVLHILVSRCGLDMVEAEKLVKEMRIVG